jgi:hypothetical protein
MFAMANVIELLNPMESVKSIKTTKCKAQKQKTTPEKSAKSLEKGAFSFQKKYRNSDDV